MNNSENDRSMEVALRERMAMLEATNSYHQESLKEISASLKEVVRTQHILANQKDEIIKLVDGLRETKEDVASLKSYRDTQLVKYEAMYAKMNEHKMKIRELEESVSQNSHFMKTVTKVSALVLSSSVVAQLVSIVYGM